MLVVAIAVFVAGLSVAITVPVFRKSQRDAVAEVVVADLREFARAFQTRFRQNGAWPAPATAAGQIPAGMESSLDRTWSARTPIGGRYLWAPDSLQRDQRYPATIAIQPLAREPVSNDRRLLEEIDRQIDDGDLRTGDFQLGYRDQPFFVIEP
jgi:type II secretory pathway pseudopilin PulG